MAWYIQCIFACLIACVCCCMGSCPPYKTGALELSANRSVVIYAKEDQHHKLDCCISGYDSMRWLYQGRDGGWSPYNADTYGNNNQTIGFRSITWRSQGFYKCIARNDTAGKTISKEIKLVTYNCTGRDIPIRRMPHSHDFCINKFPSDIEMDCAADFGECETDPLSFVDVDWYSGNNGTISELADTYLMKSGRLNVSKTGLDRKSLDRKSKLVLKNVTAADIGLKFYCSVSSPRGLEIRPGMSANENPFPVTLRNCQGAPARKIKPEIASTAGGITAGCIVTIGLILLLIFTLPRTKLFVREHAPRLYMNAYRRQYQPQRRGEYDAAVIHTDIARGSADLLRTDLEDNQYTVRMLSEDAGDRIFESAGNLVDKASTILIIPDGMEAGEWPNLISSIKDWVEDIDRILVITFNNIPHIELLQGLKHLKYVSKTSILRRRYIWKLQLHLPTLHRDDIDDELLMA